MIKMKRRSRERKARDPSGESKYTMEGMNRGREAGKKKEQNMCARKNFFSHLFVFLCWRRKEKNPVLGRE